MLGRIPAAAFRWLRDGQIDEDIRTSVCLRTLRISQVSSCGSSMYVWYIPLRTWIGRRGTCETRAHFEIPKLEYKTEFLSMALITQRTQTYVIKTSSWLRNLLVSHLPPTAFGWPWAVHRLGGPAIFQLRSLGWQKDAKVVVDVFLKFILRGFCQ